MDSLLVIEKFAFRSHNIEPGCEQGMITDLGYN